MWKHGKLYKKIWMFSFTQFYLVSCIWKQLNNINMDGDIM
jgi:hypothetical protein